MECYKCGGSGHLKQYNHYEGGVCFPCNGTGEVSYDSGQFFCHTLDIGQECHIFMRTSDGLCVYWINNCIGESYAHEDHTLDSLREKYREVRSTKQLALI